ncbi:hypothetical protein CWI75_14155 [Kineobactrum sediminis]|uniref:Pilus assembly protein PilW n=1 Tax=Kineobactrum sediminis TaxID=1905677 RepID=A0A2N5XZN5_9GAMM|nr:PilW family protein [Kineobactrum sediminis]PLW81612.1 hypothetical protein CWI75_14155 [Kineobactrum sediminis]
MTTLRYRRRNLGLGLIEIMIALGLGAIIMLGVTEIATQNSATRNEIERFGRQMESAIFAMGTIERDVVSAAFWGEKGEVTPGGTIPPVCVDSAVELEEAMGYPIQGGQGAIACTPANLQPKANTDYVAIRRVSSCALGSPGCPVAGSNFHLQVLACFEQDSLNKPGDHFLIDNDVAALDLEKRECDGVNIAPRYRFLNRIYYVNADDKLMRAELEGSSYVEQEMIENVELLRFEYGLDTDGDGQVDGYASNIASPNDLIWPQVVMVRLSMIVRSHQPSPGFTDTRTYTVGGQSYTPATFTSHRRQLYTRTMFTRNIAGRREVP